MTSHNRTSIRLKCECVQNMVCLNFIGNTIIIRHFRNMLAHSVLYTLLRRGLWLIVYIRSRLTVTAQEGVACAGGVSPPWVGQLIITLKCAAVALLQPHANKNQHLDQDTKSNFKKPEGAGYTFHSSILVFIIYPTLHTWTRHRDFGCCLILLPYIKTCTL